MMRRVGNVVLVLALTTGMVSPVLAVENPAAWDASAAYLAALPDGFNGIKGEALKARLDAGDQMFILDVRQPDEFTAGHIEGAVNVPVREVARSLDRLPADRGAPIVVVCAGAVRSGYVAMALTFKGYTNVKHLAAGYVAGWQKAGYPVTP